MKGLWIVGLLVASVCFATASAADFSKARIDIIVPASDSPVGRAIFAGARDAARELDLSIETIGAPSERDVEQQIQILKTAVATKPTGIVVAPADRDALAPPIAAATGAGIPVVVIGPPPDTKRYATSIDAGADIAGARAADVLLDCLRQQREKMAGVIVVLTDPKPVAPWLQAREEGFISGLKKHSELRIVRRALSGATIRGASAHGPNLLGQKGKVIGVFAPSAGAGAELSHLLPAERGIAHVCSVAFGTSSDELALVRSGALDALIAQNFYIVGYAGVWYALAAAHGVVLPRNVAVPLAVVTRANLNTPETARLLHPQKQPLAPFLGVP